MLFKVMKLFGSAHVSGLNHMYDLNRLHECILLFFFNQLCLDEMNA